MPSLLRALGVEAEPAALDLPRVDRACLFVIDGLGLRLLERNRKAAPFLASLLPGAQTLTAGFPTSTSVSITSLGTGRPSGEHGLVGYTMVVPAFDGVLDLLGWRQYPGGRDLRAELPPEAIQPHETAFERGISAGIPATIVTLGAHKHSGLTRAAFGRARFEALDRFEDTGRRVERTVAAFGRSERALVYTYDPRLDAAGHASGVSSGAWLDALRQVDAVAEALADGLPPSSLLAVVGDHGMVDVEVGPASQIDLADEPLLRSGIRRVAGEPRMRHIFVNRGAIEEVLGRWRERLADRWLVMTRDEAVDSGLFGPTVLPDAGSRIGDLLAIAADRVGIFQRTVAPWEAKLIGQHGALDEDELLVPLLVARA